MVGLTKVCKSCDVEVNQLAPPIAESLSYTSHERFIELHNVTFCVLCHQHVMI